MGKMKELYMDLEQLIFESMEMGARTDNDVIDYVNQRMPFKVEDETIMSVFYDIDNRTQNWSNDNG